MSDKIQSVAFQCRLIYAHDWKLENLGPLEDVLKRTKKKRKVGLHTFRVVSSKYADYEYKYQRNKDPEPGLVLGCRFLSKIHSDPRDFILERTGKGTLIPGRVFDSDKYWEQGSFFEFFFPMQTKVPPGEFELWVRAPQKISKTKIKHARTL